MRHRERRQELSAVGVRIGAHPAMAGRRQGGQLLAKASLLVEQLARPVAQHPLLKLLDMFGFAHVGDRHLVCAPGAFDRQAVDESGACPALGRLEHDHRPAGPDDRRPVGSRGCLDRADLGQDRVQGGSESLVHQRRVVTFDEVGFVAVALQQLG